MKRIILLATSLLLIFSCTAEKVVPVIFDTDMGNDIDDALALSMLYRYMDEGKIDLIGITSCKTDMTSVEFIDILGNYYGHPEIPVGKLTGAEQYERLNTYCEKIAADSCWKRSIDDYDALPESAELMADLLRKSDDSSVVIVAVGFFTNLARVLEAEPELVAAKVRKLVLMAGDFEDSSRHEHNVMYDIPAAQKVYSQWPTEIVSSPWEVGNDVLFPVENILENLSYDSANPVAEAYKVYKPMPYDRPTWDLSAVLFAVEGEGGYFSLSSPGTVGVTDDGSTVQTDSTVGNHRYMSVASAEKTLSRYLDRTSARSPARN